MNKTLQRRTIVVQGRLASREWRLRAAREQSHGLHIVTIEQLAARLAGGFQCAADDESIRTALGLALHETALGELDGIKGLPGMVDASLGTLRKVWNANFELKAQRLQHSRLDALARLETATLRRLPAGMLAPADLAIAAMQRIALAPRLLGPIDFAGAADIAACWRPLVLALAEVTPTRWLAGTRSLPLWLEGSAVAAVRSSPHQPKVECVSAATAYHEVIEALRWARELIATGRAAPSEIAIAAASPAQYDDHFLALREDANIALHFVHGIPAIATRAGQAAAALADILVRGISQSRVRRLAALQAGASVFATLPPGWTRILPPDAPLATPASWYRLLDALSPDAWPEGADPRDALRSIVARLDCGTDRAAEMGEGILSGQALAIWRKALLAGPAVALDATLQRLKIDDRHEACAGVVWASANELAGTPRRFVRLLGLNSSRWPRGITEDRLLSDHIVPMRQLEPRPLAVVDRDDFRTILQSAAAEVVLSSARRDGEGRVLGRSALLHGLGKDRYLDRNAAPAHAFSETDRLLARKAEFRALSRSVSASQCWEDWHRTELTGHDGLVRPGHPVVSLALGRIQSASSLKLLLRNPLGFVWKYGMGLRSPVISEEPLVLDALGMGNLVHLTLEIAVGKLVHAGGLGSASRETLQQAVTAAVADAAAQWETAQPVPPALIWQRTLNEVHQLSIAALMGGEPVPPGTRSYGEVRFGGAKGVSDCPAPWDGDAPVEIPGTRIRINGYIDRLDIAPDGRHGWVRDYKTGRAPKADFGLNGGNELQRCLYAYAVKAMLGQDFEVTASLLYPREQREFPLADADTALAELSVYLAAAYESLLGGASLPGKDAADTYDDLAFALPANARVTYYKRKSAATLARLGVAARVWEVK
ncbi:PD-(D/E)XK nuclease family protein [Cupriavidus respiraculi]|uniref:PD-(D/E)XK endonuclease-like domain-containing protein n=1 Tax=Cupriavidus respiraculi TaxID=195930 RepID=A0ABN7ZHY4_9BURK|nr:PD-(D/E)XK nuclease family protein [Cupriavidus respiraculi]CAG9183886.1 hypothetical protein LMG21510_04970 [Cupriavidus respiraculi]